MNQCIIYAVDDFDFQQRVYIYDKEAKGALAKFNAPMSEIPEKIAQACQSQGIGLVYIYGTPNFAASLANDIKEYAKTNYSNLELKIEVNSEEFN